MFELTFELEELQQAFPKIGDEELRKAFLILNNEEGGDPFQVPGVPFHKEKHWGKLSANSALLAANYLLGCHGVEAIPALSGCSDDPCPALYLNAGDPYVTTLVWDKDTNELLLTSYGDFISEVLEPRHEKALDEDFDLSEFVREVGGHYPGDGFEEIEGGRKEGFFTCYIPDWGEYEPELKNLEKCGKEAAREFPAYTFEAQWISGDVLEVSWELD